MNQDILYRKNDQGEFEPAYVRDLEILDTHWPPGHHLVSVRPGSRSGSYRINPNHAMVLATVREISDELCQEVGRVQALRPSKPAVTAEQREAWDRMLEAFGDGVYGKGASQQMIVDAMAELLAQKLEETVEKNPGLRGATERYQTLVAMTLNQGA